MEVKYRKNASAGDPSEAVCFAKQRKIVRCAEYYLTRCGISPDTPIRFDVATILGNRIHLIRDAFNA